MKPFQYVNAPDTKTAVALFQESGSVPIAGGTDLLVILKRGAWSPERLVNLKTAPELRSVRLEGETLSMGPLTTIGEMESHPLIGEKLPALRQAASLVASPQIRNVGTLGGNLCQSVRCWYYRHPEIVCWLKGGTTCHAREGQNRTHAIFGRGPCVAVNPSDLAVALLALDAHVRVSGPDGDREIPLGELYREPGQTERTQTVLKGSELIAKVSLRLPPPGSAGLFLKVMERAAWSFALVAVAVQVHWYGEEVKEARVVLGGVMRAPRRAPDAESMLQGRRIDRSLAEDAGRTAVSEAEPLSGNSFKATLAAKLVKRALLLAAGIEET